ncbi:antihemorrhagic factor cHLP-B-like [Hippocampus comes]|uniref:Antihemorrhagic factor cHLP-B-like n=1 Tax=Hippocampus comes TaxID=109280 RepID=A0A3Q3DRN6_HIPCM|nr:PREDICTED: antihemorrhagic factor cHLP-B-like [Hippocampus comes]
MPAQLLAAMLFCALAPRTLLGESSSAVTCDQGSAEAAANLVVRHINRHHKHGFKFRLRQVQSSKYQQIPGGCRVDVHVKLVQTKCHFTNPKPFEQCQPFERLERGAVATCWANLRVTWGAATVTRYDCATRPDPTNEDLLKTCANCSILLPLSEPTAVKAAQEAVGKYNRGGGHPSYMALLEVTHVMTRYIPSTGWVTWLELALVETNCPREAAHTFAPCTPLCPDRASHAYCKVAYYYKQKAMRGPECETYPRNSSPRLPAGAAEPTCGLLYHESPEARACEERLADHQPAVHPICPFPPVGPLQRQWYRWRQQEQWVKG